MKKALSLIKDEYLEMFSFIALLIWTISPIVEYIQQASFYSLYTTYFKFSIYLVGLLGILAYIIYLVKSWKKLKIKDFIPEILISSLLIISIISTIVSENPRLSLFGEGYRNEGLLVYIMYIGFLLHASIIKNTKYLKYILKSIILSALIITIFPLFNSKFTYANFSNVFHNSNHYGYYLMINVMLSGFMIINNEKLIKKVFYLLTYILFLYFLIRNNTFGCYLAIMISFFFLFIYAMIKKYQRKSVILLIVIFIFTSFLVSYFDIKIGERIFSNDTSGIILKNFKVFSKDVNSVINDNTNATKAGSGRGLLWKEAINYTLDHPIVGGGMECLNSYYDYISGKYGVSYNDRPHNMILQVSSFIGIPGALIYIALILYIAITNLKIMKNNNIQIMVYFTAMCYFISSMFGNSMYYTSPYFMILLGILIGFIRRKEKNRLTK